MSETNLVLKERSVALIVSKILTEKKIVFILVTTGTACLLGLYLYYKFCTHMNKKKFEENYQSTLDEINRYVTRKRLYIKKKQEQLKAKKEEELKQSGDEIKNSNSDVNENEKKVKSSSII